MNIDGSPESYIDKDIDKYNVVVTAHSKNDDILIITLFGIDQWDMISSTAASLDIAVEDIIRELNPSEATQYEITSDDWDEFFVESGMMDYDDQDMDDL